MRKMFKKGMAAMLALLLCTSTVNLPVLAETTQTQESTMQEEQTEENATQELQTQEESQVEETSDEEKTEEASSVTTEEQTEENTVEEEQTTEIKTEVMETPETQSVYETDTFKVTCTLSGSWEGGYNAVVKIENIGASPIENWYLGFILDHEIANIWNAEIDSAENGNYIIKNAGWNADIPVGASAEFGFGANKNFSGFPTEYKLLGEISETEKTDYEISYQIDSDWGSGFTASICITNNTESTLEDWVLEFDYTSNITNLWNANIYSVEGDHYIIKNAGYNANIEPKQTISFGFTGEYEEALEEPYNYSLHTYRLSEPATEQKEEDQRTLTWDQMQDTDNDGLPDAYEMIIGTDLENADTDGDGLTDGYEVLYASLNPCDKYTMQNGISDADLDLDQDGLTTLKEYQLDTDPLEADTDKDGLTDGDELSKYHTDPLKYDTDGDGIGDGNEITIGLDPCNPSTFGYPDAEYQAVCAISAEDKLLQDINQNNDDYTLSLEIQGKGNSFEHLIVRESAYTDAIDNDSILGTLPELLSTSDKDIDNVKLTFTISEKNWEGKNSSEDLFGIKRYNIFWYNEDAHILLPLNTTVDEAAGTISAEAAGLGTYCVMDVEKWLGGLGYELTDADSDMGIASYSLQEDFILMEEEEEVPTDDEDGQSPDAPLSDEEWELYNSDFGIMAFSDVEGEEEPQPTEPNPAEKADIVFCYNNGIKGLTYWEYKDIKANMIKIGEGIFSGTKDAHIYMMVQTGNNVAASSGLLYASNIDEWKEMVGQLTNVKYNMRGIDRQIKKMTGSLKFREDAYKTAIFMGASYYTAKDILPLVPKLAELGMHCCVVAPNANEGSFFANLARDTDGILLGDYHSFSDDVLNFIYGYIPQPPVDPQVYKMMTSAGLRTVRLVSELRVNGTADTDSDGLTDWQETDQRYVKANEDGSVTLMSYRECCGQLLEYMDAGEWYMRFGRTKSSTGKPFPDILSEIYVLPIVSDPTMIDSDLDGILDIQEFTWDEIDERYKKMGPLHKDTIETLFPELKDTEINNPKYPTYLTVEDNDVVMHLNVTVIYDDSDADKDAVSALKTTELKPLQEKEMNNIINRLADENGCITFKDLALDGIERRWEGIYEGNKYDFHEGLSVDFSIEISEKDVSESGQKRVILTFIDGRCGVSNQSGLESGWKTNCTRCITMYSSYCDNKDHVNQSSVDCTDYQKSLYHPAQYQGTAAHEFGHVFGLQDMYYYASVNNGYEPVSNEEIKYTEGVFSLPQANGIMIYNGKACENDIEMLLLAFCENTWQYFVPYGTTQIPSKAIKYPTQYRNDRSNATAYLWDEDAKEFIQ